MAPTVDLLTRHRLRLLGLDPEALDRLSAAARARALYRRFLEAVPYENYSALARRHAYPADPSAWPRGTDRLLTDAHEQGLGGTCFSLAYALADLLRGVGVAAHTALAHHLAHEEPHALVLVHGDEGPALFDPACFVGEPLPVWPGSTCFDGVYRWSLRPRRGPLLEVVRAGPVGPPAPLYSLVPMPAPPEVFRRLWIEAVGRRATRPGRLARRRGAAVVGFREEAGCVDVITAHGHREVPLGPAAVTRLHHLLDVPEATLRAHLPRPAG